MSSLCVFYHSYYKASGLTLNTWEIERWCVHGVLICPLLAAYLGHDDCLLYYTTLTEERRKRMKTLRATRRLSILLVSLCILLIATGTTTALAKVGQFTIRVKGPWIHPWG